MQPIPAMGHRHHELALVALERAQLRYPGKARFKLYEPHRFAAHWASWTVYFKAVRCRHEQRLRHAPPILLVLNPCLQRWQHVKLGNGRQCATTLRTRSTSRQLIDHVQRLGLWPKRPGSGGAGMDAPHEWHEPPEYQAILKVGKDLRPLQRSQVWHGLEHRSRCYET